MEHMGTTAQGTITKLYQFVNRLHSGVPYHLSGQAGAFPPWHYFFEITRRCNLRCKMCQYIDFLENVPIPEQRDGELTTEEWLSVVDQTGPMSLITFTGGEVWVRKDFPTILERACSKRRVHFISNAVMLTDDKAEFCVGLAPKRFGGKGLNFIGVSIDGTEEIHNVIRAQKGAYKRSIDGIKNIVRWREKLKKAAPLVHINTVILEENLDVLPEMPRLAAEAGVSVLNLLTEMRAPDNADLGHVDPGTFGPEHVRIPTIDRARLDAALRATLKEARALGVEVRLPRMPYEMVLDHYDGGYDLDHMDCRSIWTNLYVGAKGGAYPCFINNIGNVREFSLKELWNNSQAKKFRKNRRDGAYEVCRGCCEMEYVKKALPGRSETISTAEPSPGTS
jgi:MoaA/NifB/PqqE/SkfB family radical SAM enzyme